MWNRKNAEERIAAAIAQVKSVEVRDLPSVATLANVGLTQGWRTAGAHAYVQILNVPELLETGEESERTHRRLLRFLHAYQRVAHVVLLELGARAVDFQDHRLHFLVAEPGDALSQVARAVTVADTLGRLLREANDLHTELPDARVRVGIDVGVAVAVQNGTKGDREPLYLGNPANRAAKLLDGAEGIYVTDEARRALGLGGTGALSASALDTCAGIAGGAPDVAKLVRRWEEVVKATPLQTFAFTRPTPPLSGLDLDSLSPGQSRRLEAAVLQADIDGFTRYVADRIADRSGEEAAVRALHVIRKELRDVLHDFGGRKIRYVGDCLVGVLAEGRSATDHAATMRAAVRCAGAMRDSFGIIIERIPDADELGLAIGIDAGPVSISRLGPQASRFRCLVGTAVVGAEATQGDCDGHETALGAGARDWASGAVKELFPGGRASALSYNRVCHQLDLRDEGVAVGAAVASIRPRAWGSS